MTRRQAPRSGSLGEEFSAQDVRRLACFRYSPQLLVRLVSSLRLLLLLLALLGLPLAAAPLGGSWQPFHEALDSFEYDRAQRLALAMEPGTGRELALAEVAVVSGMPHRSFAHTDRVDAASLPDELRAKYYLVRAHQELVLRQPSHSERTKVVARLVAEGLRHPGSPRDRTRLLLFRLQQDWALELETTRSLVSELAAEPGAGTDAQTEAQARAAERETRFLESAGLWSMLAENAHLRDKETAAVVYASKALKVRLRARTDQPELFAQARQLLDRALHAKDAVAVLAVWGAMYGSIPQADRKYLLDSIVQSLDQLPKSDARLLLTDRLIALGSEPLRPEMTRAAAQLAKELRDPVLEVDFLGKLWLSLRDAPEKQAEIGRQIEALLPVDERGVPGILFSYRWKPDPSQEHSLQTLESRLAGLDPVTGQQQRVTNVLTDHLMSAVEQVDAPLAERSFFQALEESLLLPARDRGTALNFLLNAAVASQWPHRPPDLDSFRGTLPDALSAAIGEKLRRRPALFAGLLDAEMQSMRRQPVFGAFGAKMLASWLSMVSRHQEAAQVLELSAQDEPNEREQAEILADAGGVRLDGGDRGGYALLRAATVAHPWSGRVTASGWEALKLGDFAEAERWARQALAGSPELRDLMNWETYQLLALALAGKGKAEEGLEVLEQGLAAATPKHPLKAYGVVRADLLLGLGRVEEARAILADLPMAEIIRVLPYELDVRRRVAAAAGDKESAVRLERAVDDFLSQPSSMPEDPIFAHYLGQVLGRSSPLPPETTEVSFAEVAEGLERLRRREPDNVALARLSMADLKRLSRDASAKDIIVHPLLLEHSVAFVMISQRQVAWLEIFCDRPRLDKGLGKLAAAMSSNNSRPETMRAEWAFLSSQLIEPWRVEFPDAERLCWLADGALAKVPLCALPEGDGTLRDSMSVTYLDGPGLADVKLGEKSRALLVGGASDLPGSGRELAVVRRLFPEGESWLLGGDFSKLRDEVARAQLVHVSTHGAMPSARRSLSGEILGDGHHVSAFQLSELTFSKGSLAVVAACESFLDAGTGRDNTSLVSAFRAAGAEVVVGSLWELDDEVTAVLMEAFYRRLQAGDAPDRALATAQGEVARSWPHPYYWAGLQVVSGP